MTAVFAVPSRAAGAHTRCAWLPGERVQSAPRPGEGSLTWGDDLAREGAATTCPVAAATRNDSGGNTCRVGARAPNTGHFRKTSNQKTSNQKRLQQPREASRRAIHPQAALPGDPACTTLAGVAQSTCEAQTASNALAGARSGHSTSIRGNEEGNL